MRRLIDVGLALGYAGLIYFLSSLSTISLPKGIWSFDKVIHCVEYGVLAFLIARAIRAPSGQRLALVAVAAWFLSTLYGMSDEFHQYFVPGRSSDGYDILADSVGSVLGAGAFTFHSRRASGVTRDT